MRGTPDWYELRRETVPVVARDLGELATRLGAPTSVDRLGHIEIIDSFENGVGGWARSTGAATDEINVVGDKVYHGGYGFQLKPSGDAGSVVYVSRSIWCPHNGNAGFEARFHIESNPSNIQWQLIHYDGTTRTQFSARIDVVNEKLEYFDINGNWIELASNIDLPTGTYVYAYVKIIIDLENVKYKRVLYNANAYALDDVDGEALSSTVEHSIDAQFRVVPQTNVVGDVRLDAVITTFDEP